MEAGLRHRLVEDTVGVHGTEARVDLRWCAISITLILLLVYLDYLAKFRRQLIGRHGEHRLVMLVGLQLFHFVYLVKDVLEKLQFLWV